PKQPFDIHFQLVPLDKEFETDKEKEKDHPILKILDEYASEVKRSNFLARMPRAQHLAQVQLKGQNVHFVGSDACKNCHGIDHGIWANSHHSHAYETLEKKAVKPGLRQFDPECVVCHVIGYQYQTGFENEKKTPHLRDVGCESCHGPGSQHVAN